MAAIANSPSFAKKVGVPQSVGQDFSNADKGKKFSKGGDMASKMNSGFMAMMAKKKAESGKMAAFEKSGKDVEKKGVKEGSKADMAMDKKQMMGMKKMAEGGKADMKQDKSMMQKAVNKHEGRLHKGASMTKLARGGGIETKGKTKGKMIVMKKGGQC